MIEVKAYIRPAMIDDEIILQHGRTGRAGEGMVFVSTVSRAFRIRDGRESLDAADAAPG